MVCGHRTGCVIHTRWTLVVVGGGVGVGGGGVGVGGVVVVVVGGGGGVVVVVVVVLTLTRIIKSVVTGQVPITLERKLTYHTISAR